MWNCEKIIQIVPVVLILQIIRITTVNSQQQPSQYAQHCYMISCLGCPAHAVSRRGDSVECHPSNWVSPVWLHNLGHPPPSTASVFPVEYRCMKMVATPDDSTHGHTVDVIRGCVPAVQVDSVCTGLVAVERARGHSDARCFVCRGDNCNYGGNKMASATLLLTAVIILFLDESENLQLG